MLTCFSSAVVAAATFGLFGGNAVAASGADWAAMNGPVSPWPRPIPARVLDAGAAAKDDLLVFTLGDVRSPLANATFDPAGDRLTFADGRVVERYYAGTLGIRHYAAMDKARFPLPPSGWCSWYFYYQDLTAADVLENARWLGANFRDYGVRYIQIDDAWQGKGRGLADNRDWTVTDARFKEPGMPGLAKAIRELGFEAGIWLVPFGQSSAAVAAKHDVWLTGADGKPIGHEWVGTYMLDPTAPGAAAYLTDLHRTLREWGYTYFKTDGFPPTIDVYAGNIGAMRRAPTFEAGKNVEAAQDLFRSMLPAIRTGIGDDAYWLGCWGISLPAIGHVNGGRTAGDVNVWFNGYLHAIDAIQNWALLHNIAWYSDPDVVIVRPPLSDGVARSWATALALSGQSLLTSDRLMDLPASRLDLLKRIYPATDVRAIDLFKRGADMAKNAGEGSAKVADTATRVNIWNLKVAHGGNVGRAYDVVGVFNFDQKQAESRRVSWAELGLDASKPHHVFDYWSGVYLGAWSSGVFLDVPPGDVRVLSVVPMEDRPVVLSTNRHVTQGWVDLKTLKTTGSGTAWTVEGESAAIGGSEYTLAFGLPRSGPGMMEITGFEAVGADGKPVAATFSASQGWASAGFWNAATQTVKWKATFGPATRVYSHPVRPELGISVEPAGKGSVRATWGIQWAPAAAFVLELDGQPLGTAFSTSATLRGLETGREYTLRQRPAWYDGTVAGGGPEVKFRAP
jgi:hypothetical protein